MAWKVYTGYGFHGKDPVIEEIRTIFVNSQWSYEKLSEMSGVNVSTLRSWFYGETMRPQHCTVEAVFRALGYESVRDINRGNIVDMRKRKRY